MEEKTNLYGDGVHDDTGAIQTMLDRRGTVRVPDGQYRITRPLIIHSDTRLLLSPLATLRLADGANCSLLDNDGLYSDEPNENIVIEGGIWDGNHMAQERQKIPNEGRPGDANEDQPCDKEAYLSNRYLVLLMRLVHTRRLQIRNLTFRDPTSYAVQIADCRCFLVENITLDYDLLKPNMDGIHIQGPARFGRIRNIRGNANDDHVALCANGTIRSEITRGAIEDIDIEGIYCDNGYTGVRLLSRGDAVRNVNISNIYGEFRFYAVSLTHHYPLREDRPVLIENVRISDIFASKSRAACAEDQKAAVEGGALIWFESGIVCRNITVENVYRNERNTQTKAATVHIGRGVKASGLRLKNINNTFANEWQTSVENKGGIPCERD